MSLVDLTGAIAEKHDIQAKIVSVGGLTDVRRD